MNQLDQYEPFKELELQTTSSYRVDSILYLTEHYNDYKGNNGTIRRQWPMTLNETTSLTEIQLFKGKVQGDYVTYPDWISTTTPKWTFTITRTPDYKVTVKKGQTRTIYTM